MFFLLDSTCWHLRMWMIQLNVLSSLSLITALKLDILHMKITGYCELCSKGWFTEQHNRQLLLASSDDFIPCCCFSNRKQLYLGWVSDPSHRFFFYPLFHTCPWSILFWLFWILKSMRVRNRLHLQFCIKFWSSLFSYFFWCPWARHQCTEPLLQAALYHAVESQEIISPRNGVSHTAERQCIQAAHCLK